MTIDHTCVVLATRTRCHGDTLELRVSTILLTTGIVRLCILMFDVRCIALLAPLTVSLFVCLFFPRVT